MNFTIHDANGRILRIGFCPDGMEECQAKQGESMLKTAASLDLHYVSKGALLDRPMMGVVLSATTLTGLPVPCTITVDRTDYPCSEPTCELDLVHVGTYTVRVSAWPHIDKVFKVTKT